MVNTNKKWVALCSLAIGAIYAADFYTTEPQAHAMQPLAQAVQAPAHEWMGASQAQASTPVVSPKPSAQPLSPSKQPTSSSLAQAPNQSEASQGFSSAGNNKNGTYVGTGSNRRGSIEVTVTINSGKITDVEISRFAMHYSKRDVVGMPAEVVQIQSAMVKNVSGATYSTRAFQDAVQAALKQAQNA